MFAGLPILLAVDDASRVGEARRAAVAIAKSQGFDEPGQGRAAIVATEAASNLLKHARSGVLLLRALDTESDAGVEILALDKGPGMEHVARFLQDGVSTAGTAGNGLGAIARQSEVFAIHSLPGVGTALLARLLPSRRTSGEAHPGLEIGAVTVPMPGEEVCGDAWSVQTAGGRTRVLVVDGLGHGPLAAATAREAVLAFQKHADSGPQGIIQAVHEALRATRGAAVAVAEIDSQERALRFAGVGNIAGSVLRPGGRGGFSLVSHSGTAGAIVRRIQEFVHPWDPDSLLIMHSDGLTSHWNLQHYHGLEREHPGLVAGVLYRDFQRGRDDVTVLAVRERSAST